jgi:hypothetical protein
MLTVKNTYPLQMIIENQKGRGGQCRKIAGHRPVTGRYIQR